MTTASRLRPGRSNAWALYLVAMGLLIGAYLFVPPFKGYALVVNAIGIASLAAIAWGVFANRSRARLAWGLMIAGQFLYVSGDFYTYTYPDLLGGTVGFPSFGDAIYLSVYPLLFGGLMLLVRRRDPSRSDSGAVLDSLVLTVGFALLFWVFLIAPNVHASGLTPLAKVVSTAYPLGDVLLLGAVIRFAVQAGRKSAAFYLLFASTAALLLTDCAYNYALLHGTYDHQVIFDLGWLAYLTLWGAAALHPSMRVLEEPSRMDRARLTPTRLGLLAVACLIAPGIRFVEEFNNKDLLVIIGSSAILFLLVVLRVAGLARQEEKAAAREATLREAGLALVEAVGRANVHQEAVESAVRIVGGDVRVRLALWNDDLADVVASNGAGSWALTPEAVAWLRSRHHPVSTADPSEPVSAALGLGFGATTVVLTLSLPDQDQGAIVIQSSEGIPLVTLDALGSLASQVSLAIDASALSEERNRRQSEARFRSLVAHSSDLITVLDENGVIKYQSPSIERLLGYSVDEVEGSVFGELLADADRSRLDRILEVAEGSDSHTFECGLRHQDGRWLKFEVQHTHLLDDEHVQGIVLNSRDISERKAFEEQLAHQAFHDPVTGLANRALFADRVAHALRSTVRKGSLVAIMF
ncbi:MAG TPA: PAS domain S-box protein, partial [Gaiellaceae bacterium]